MQNLQTVDGFGVYVDAGDTARIERIFERHGLEPSVLEGPAGDGKEEVVCVGSIDGDQPVSVSRILMVLSDLWDPDAESLKCNGWTCSVTASTANPRKPSSAKGTPTSNT
jgi:hypothetical protein